MGAIAKTLEAIVKPEEICPWEQLDEAFQQQVVRAIQPDAMTSPPIGCVVYPSSQEALAAVMALAHQQRWRVLPCGNGSQLSWGGLAAGVDLVISTARLNRLLEFAVGDLTVTAEAGMKWADVQAHLAPVQQFLAVDPTDADLATLGGIVATADTGSLRQRYGGVRDMLLGLSFVRSDGQLAKAGGRVVKNVAGYDLMKLLTGSYGSLAIVTQVTFRLYPLPVDSRTIVLTGSADAIATTTRTILDSSLVPVALDLLSAPLVAELQVGPARSQPEMALIAQFRNVAESVQEQCRRLQEIGSHHSLAIAEFSGADEMALWQRLKVSMSPAVTEAAILCKIGVLSAQATDWLVQVAQLAPQAKALIHAGSGLGRLHLPGDLGEAALLQTLRSHCQANGGFLTLLQAPPSLKQQLDVWGYAGNALPLMEKLKHQFDPHRLLSPQRFVGGL